MSRFAGPFFVLAALALAAPAAAQIAGRPVPEPAFRTNPFVDDGRMPGPSTRAEMRQVRRNIEQYRESGIISRREARQLRRESRRIEAAALRYGRDGLSGSERAELAVRSQALRSTLPRPRAAR